MPTFVPEPEVRFTGVLRAARGGGHAIDVDERLAGSLGARHMSRVRGTVNGTSYRSTVARMGGVVFLGVHAATVRAAGIAVGDSVEVTMALDDEPREGDAVPPILEAALERSKLARAAWDELAPSHRREHIGYIMEAKKAATRSQRVERTIATLEGRGAGP